MDTLADALFTILALMLVGAIFYPIGVMLADWICDTFADCD